MSGSISRGLAVSTMAVLLLATPLLSVVPAFADETVAKPEVTSPKATYDETQPGADDPHVKEGFAAYQSGDFKKAYDIWLPLAEAGNAEAQFRIGRLYDFGEGEEENKNKTIFWYRQAAKQAHANAAYNLGLLYATGEEGKKDLSQALEYYLIAARENHAKAQHSVGILFAVIAPPRRNFSEAYRWLLIAVSNGRPEAQQTIEKLDKIAKVEERDLGEKKMREWVKTHSRRKSH